MLGLGDGVAVIRNLSIARVKIMTVAQSQCGSF